MHFHSNHQNIERERWVIEVDLVEMHRKIHHQIRHPIRRVIRWMRCRRPALWPIHALVNSKKVAICHPQRHHQHQQLLRPQPYSAVDYPNMATQRWIQSHNLPAHHSMPSANAKPKRRMSKLPNIITYFICKPKQPQKHSTTISIKFDSDQNKIFRWWRRGNTRFGIHSGTGQPKRQSTSWSSYSIPNFDWIFCGYIFFFLRL